MEILLLQDIPGIGKKNDLLIVGDGYALNCLLPHRKALVATPTVRRRYAEEIKRRAEEKQKEIALKSSAVGKIMGKEVAFSRKATKTGKLYAALTEKNLSAAIREQLSADVPESAITIVEPIKAVGDFEVKVKLGEHEQSLKVVVKAEA
ncbi:MAG: 50S ribosomal protein L9 [Candidatus Peribacteraceae bacterium]|nr:50S ribosomal protein L9 [Candidatus Peribacteraceae bacterium]